MPAPSDQMVPTLDHPVWQALVRHDFGPRDAALGFAQRLARDNGWSLVQAERVIEEYRRFCFLAVTADHVVTPSDAVDQAWHLHLTYSRDYWEHFCPEVLGRPLHHGPTRGGMAEQAHFAEAYARTLRSYAAMFGPAPVDLWPSAQRRFIEDPKARRVHPRDAIIIPRRQLRVALAICAILLCAALALTLGWGF